MSPNTPEHRAAPDRAGLREMFALPSSYAVNKVRPLEGALREFVKPGMTLHYGYSEGRPMATSSALVRCFAGTDPGFTLISAGLVGYQAPLITEKLVKRLIVSFVGENYPTPTPNRILQDAINSGEVEIENQSLLVIHQRLAAGAFGFPFALTRSLSGSSLAKNPNFAEVNDPFGSGEKIGAVRALMPDITFIHGLAGDAQGNILLSPPFGESEIAAFAAKHGVIATVERVVSPDVVRRNAHLVKVPAHRVLSVSETPLGCHPYAIFNPGGIEVPDYVEDYEFFMEARAASKNIDTFRAWTRKWILEVADHEDYLRKLGPERVNALRGRSTNEGWQEDLDRATVERIAKAEGHDAVEMMVVAAAHVLERKVRGDGFGIVEAGVGYANLAAWLAVSKLQHDGIPAELVAEIGLYGFLPKPGETFIFSNRNLASCKSLTGVETILGLYVSGRHNNCLAIIGAGQIDPAGNINSTYSADGRFLVGSGGANDIAAAAREIIAVTQQSKQRLVSELPYVTSPGKHLTTLVTDLGIYQKREGRLVLTEYFPAEGLDQAQCVERVRSRCGWELAVADDLTAVAPPGADELLRLRLYDSRNDFLSHTAG